MFDERHDCPRYFHVAPILLGTGSVIHPGNWGRILRLYQAKDANFVLYRETVLEQIRANEFSCKPSRLNCLFLLRSREDAIHYMKVAAPLGLVYEVVVDNPDAEMHLGDYNFGGNTSSVSLLTDLPQIARDYWTLPPTDAVEVLYPGSATVVACH